MSWIVAALTIAGLGALSTVGFVGRSWRWACAGRCLSCGGPLDIPDQPECASCLSVVRERSR